MKQKLETKVEEYSSLCSEFEDLQVLIDMAIEENDPSIIPDILEAYESYTKKAEDLRIKTLQVENIQQQCYYFHSCRI